MPTQVDEFLTMIEAGVCVDCDAGSANDQIFLYTANKFTIFAQTFLAFCQNRLCFVGLCANELISCKKAHL